MTMTKTPCGVVEGIISLLVCSGGKKYWGEGAGPSSFGSQPRLSEITIEPISGVLLKI